jgi:hypothetical protein
MFYENRKPFPIPPSPPPAAGHRAAAAKISARLDGDLPRIPKWLTKNTHCRMTR